MKRLIALLSLAMFAASMNAHADVVPTKVGKVASGRAPYTLIGQLFFASGGDDYIGSGSVIRKSSILTAGHNLYDPDNGWSTDLLFRRAAYGDTVRSEQYGQKIFLLGGYRQNATRYGSSTVRAFASDTGGVRFPKMLAGGAVIPWISYPKYLSDAARYKLAIGYGAEGAHTGDFPLQVTPNRGFASTYGSFWESRGTYFEGGMSGGPVFALGDNGVLYVAAIIVSGADTPIARGGVRVIDTTTANFIWTYLR